MALHDFLINKRADILVASERRVVALAALRLTSDQLQNGLPLFLDQLVDVLQRHGSLSAQKEAPSPQMAVRNLPGTGCVFTVDLPRHSRRGSEGTAFAAGAASTQALQ